MRTPARLIPAAAFALLLTWAQWEQLGPPADSAQIHVLIEPRMPARVYLFKGNASFRLGPADAMLPIKTDLFYRDPLWTKSADPKVLEVIASDQLHTLLLKGEATFYVPPGSYRMEAYRGLFYTPADAEFTLKPNEKRQVVLRLNPWEGVNPKEWISSDDHIHLTRARLHDSVFLAWLEAEDLTVGNFLQLQRQMDAAVQYGFGKQAEARRGGYVIRSGQESRNEFWGHINLLGPERLVRPLSTGTMYANTPESYPFPSVIFEQGRKLGATVGYAHFFQPPQHSSIYMDAALGNIDFVEVFQFGVLKTGPWYELLNAGLRVTGIAGSDFPVNLNGRRPWPHWLPLIGPERTLVKASPGPNSYTDWAEGVREGRVVVSNGPLVELNLDPATGKGEATAAFWRPLEILEIVRNGEVIAWTKGDRNRKRLQVSAETRAPGQSAWIAARVRAESKTGEPDIQAHTNPVYLLHNNQPVRVESARRAVAAKWEQEMTYFRNAGITFPRPAEEAQFREAAGRALAALQQ